MELQKINPVQLFNTLLHSNKDMYVQNVHAYIHLYTYVIWYVYTLYVHIL